MNPVDVKIIKLLIEHKEEYLSINQIAILLKKDYKNIHNIVTRLSHSQVIILKQLGNAHQVTLHNKLSPLVYETEYTRRNELLRNKDIAVLYDSFKGLRSQFYILLVFGSYAKKTQTKHSDLDLLFIVPDNEDDKMEREIGAIAQLLPLKLHINIFTETEFKQMKNSKEITVGSEAIKNNVILHGIEAYYELIQ